MGATKPLQKANTEESKKDPSSTVFHNSLAATKCEGAEAQYQVGRFYETGEGGVEVDQVKVVEWYQKAVEQHKHEGAYYSLGVAYEEGKGVEHKDLRRAVVCYHHATKKVEHKEAKRRLNNLIQQLENDAENSDKRNGEAAESIRILGYCYDNGLGVVENEGKALDLYIQANKVSPKGGRRWTSIFSSQSSKKKKKKDETTDEDSSAASSTTAKDSKNKKPMTSAEWLYHIGAHRVTKYEQRTDIDSKIQRLEALIAEAKSTNEPDLLKRAIVAEKELALLHDLCRMERFKSISELHKEISVLEKKRAKPKTTLEQRLELSRQIEVLQKRVQEQEQDQICFCM